MPVTYASPPAVGDAEPAHLYADLQSRSLWLGVDPLVDPVGAVLISDIVAMQAEIDAANAYTDTQVATRALTVHTHVAAQITDFNAAVAAAIVESPEASLWVRGMILMWSGSLVEIGVGELLGWALCDGENDTPDLRDRFVISVGPTVTAGSVNSASSAVTTTNGAHTHVLGATALTTAHMPSHTHTFTGSPVAVNSGGQSVDHTHSYTRRGVQVSVQAGTSNFNVWDEDTTVQTTGASVGHYHSVTTTAAGTIAATGSGTAHSHSIDTVAGHGHGVTSAQLRAAIPYYALAFIMKL